MRIYIKFNQADTCFYIFWCFLQFGKAMGYTADNPRFLVLLACGIPFAILKIVFTKWKFDELIKCIMLNLLGVAVTLFSETSTYLLSVFCITAVKDMDIKKVLKFNLIIRGPMFLIRTTMALLGFADMEIDYRFEGDVMTGIRYALGYDNPNTTQFELFMIIVLFFLLNYKKVRAAHYLLALAYNTFIYQYTDSRTPWVLCIVFLAGMFLSSMRWGTVFNRVVAFWASKSWNIGLILSLLGCILYVHVPAFRNFGTFSSRFQTAVDTIEDNIVPLFGTTGIYTDLGFVYIVYSAGLLLAALFYIGLNKLLRLREMREECVIQWAFLCLAIFTILEHTAFSVLSNGLLLYLTYAVYPKKKLKREQNLRIGEKSQNV